MRLNETLKILKDPKVLPLGLTKEKLRRAYSDENNHAMPWPLKCVDITEVFLEQFVSEVLIDCFPGPYLQDYIVHCHQVFQSLMGQLLVDTESGKVAGGVVARVQESKTDPGSGCQILYIEMLAVRSQYRRHGLAKRMLEEVENVAQSQGVHYIELHVSFSNVFALLFYFENGFQLRNVEENFYRNVKGFKASHTGLLLSKEV